MAMDFWEAQRQARKLTTLYITVFILLTIVVAVLAELAMHAFAQENYDPPLPYVGMAFLGVTIIVALYQYSMYRLQGGGYVAESMGGIRLTSANIESQKEQQLLNIVEEMAIAASVPVPAVYLINAREINAFAAGLSQKEAAIAVTVGCVNLLNRDELQGVIAHEFGHIHNWDMILSTRLSAMVMGFFFVLYIAMRLLQFSSFSSNRDDKKNGGNVLMLAALVLVIAGAFTWFAGTILQCMVSRQREYLADACSVQFTRNSQGIANALRKIAGMDVHDMPKSGIAFSHMYFEDSSFWGNLFASHPPIGKRIAAIEGKKYAPPSEENSPKS